MKKTSRLLILLLILSLCIGLFTVSALAETVNYNIWILGKPVTSENASDIFGDGKVSYDADTKTLTVSCDLISKEGPAISAPTNKELTINLVENVIISADNGNAIFVPNGDQVTIDAAGDVTISAAGGSAISAPNGDNVMIESAGDVAISAAGGSAIFAPEGTVSIDADHVSVSANGGNAIYAGKDGADIKAAGDVDITAANGAAIFSPNGDNVNIDAAGDVTIRADGGNAIFTIDGSVNIDALGAVTVSADGGNAIFAPEGDNITIDAAGDVVITAIQDSSGEADNGIAVYAPNGENVNIDAAGGVTISADGGSTIFNVGGYVGIDAAGDVTVENKGDGSVVVGPLAITGEEVWLIGNPVGGMLVSNQDQIMKYLDAPTFEVVELLLTYQNASGKAYKVYEGADKNALEEVAGQDGTYTSDMDVNVIHIEVPDNSIFPWWLLGGTGCICDPYTDVDKSAWYHEAVDYALETGLMTGLDETTFAPNGTMTRAMVWTVLGRLSGQEFDGTGANWYVEAQNWAIANGISDGTNPNGAITREELVTMLWRFVGQPAASENPLHWYNDGATVSDWAADAMAWAVNSQIVEGSNYSLNPQGTALRAQVAAILMRYFG